MIKKPQILCLKSVGFPGDYFLYFQIKRKHFFPFFCECCDKELSQHRERFPWDGPNFHSQNAQHKNSCALCARRRNIFVRARRDVCVWINLFYWTHSRQPAASATAAFAGLCSRVPHCYAQVTMKIYPCCRKPHPPKCMQLLAAALRDYASIESAAREMKLLPH